MYYVCICTVFMFRLYNKQLNSWYWYIMHLHTRYMCPLQMSQPLLEATRYHNHSSAVVWYDMMRLRSYVQCWMLHTVYTVLYTAHLALIQAIWISFPLTSICNWPIIIHTFIRLNTAMTSDWRSSSTSHSKLHQMGQPDLQCWRRKSMADTPRPSTTTDSVGHKGRSENTRKMVVKNSRKNVTNPMRVGLYEIGAIIGEGNFATVRYARHKNTDSDVSIIWKPFWCVNCIPLLSIIYLLT